MTAGRLLRSAWAKAIGANAATGVLSLLASSMLARALGPEARGSLGAIVVWSGILFAGFGLPSVQAVVIRGPRGRRGATAVSALVAAGLSSAVLLPAAIAINHALFAAARPDLLPAATLFAASLPLTLVTGSASGILLGEGDDHGFWTLRVLEAAVYAATVTWITVTARATIWTATVSMVVAAVAALGYAIWRYLRRDGPGELRHDPALTRDIAAFGLKANLAGLPYHLNQRFDQALMVLLVPRVVLGTYVVAFAWSSIVVVLGGGISSVMLQRSAVLSTADATAREPVMAGLRMTAIGLAGLALLVAASAPLAIPLIFGGDYRAAVIPAVILSGAGAVLAFTLCVHEVARGLGHPQLGIPAELIGLAVTLGLLWVLLPRYGGLGAAIASLIAYCVTLGVLVALLDRRTAGQFARAAVPRKSDARKLRGALLDALAG